jgi:preprotein translocase subunit SecE
MKAIVEYLAGVKDEMGKVTWPSKDEVVQATTLVVVFALVLSLVVAGFDTLVALVVGKIL